MKYTAEEVRALFEAWAEENGYDVLRIEPDYNDGFTAAAWHSYQAAFADRIEADEGVANKLVVPVAWMCETVNGYKVFNPEGPSFPCNAGVVSELFTHPPAQAAQSVDVAKVREVAADIRHWNEAICHPALNVFADKLEAAIKGES